MGPRALKTDFEKKKSLTVLQSENYRFIRFKPATLFQGLLLLFHAIQFVKCWRFFPESNSKGLHLRLNKE